jgi:hypothetical protein
MTQNEGSIDCQMALNGRESAINRAIDGSTFTSSSYCLLLFTKEIFSCSEMQQLIHGIGNAI